MKVGEKLTDRWMANRILLTYQNLPGMPFTEDKKETNQIPH